MTDDPLARALQVLSYAGRLPADEREKWLVNSLADDPESAASLGDVLRATAAAPGLASALREAFDQRTPPEFPASRPQQVGERIGKYRLERLLGEGGMGQVFVARDEALGRTVAIKTIRADVALATEARQRFHREARILSHLEHPRICRLYDAFAVEGTDVLVLEHIEGRPLSAVLRQAPQPLARALQLAVQICEALLAAHATGIVHRDLKPANVMLRQDDSLKVLDFGIARSVDAPGVDHPATPTTAPGGNARPDTGPELTESGTVLGTLLYMSPEQARGEPVGPAADLFPLGLMLVEMLSGASPRPRARDRTEALFAARQGETVPLDGLPAPVRPLLRQLLCVDPARRPSALETLSSLHALARAPARRRRRRLVAAVLVAFLAFGAKYVVDLDAERREAEEQRGRAELARDAAEARRSQAEGLFGFAVGDLFERLGDLGRLDLLEGVGERALAYVEAIPPGEMSDEELHGHVRNLYQFGEVRFSLDDRDGARRLYATAVDLGHRLVARDPTRGPWLKTLGAAEFYVGQIAYDQGQLDDAEAAWRAYLEIAEQLVALDPSDTEWQIELAYAHTNLGAIHQARGDGAAARQAFEQVTQRWEQLLAAAPDDDDHRFELADALSWLGSALQVEGRLSEARDVWERELVLRQELLQREDAPVVRRLHLAQAYGRLAGVDELLVGGDAAAVRFEQAAAAMEGLLEHDPRNASWRFELAVQLLRAVEAWSSAEQDARAGEALRRARPHVERLTQDDQDRESAGLLSDTWAMYDALLAAHSGNQAALDSLVAAVTALDVRLERIPGLRDAQRIRVGAWQLLAEERDRWELADAAEAAWRRVLELTEDTADRALLRSRVDALKALGQPGPAAELTQRLQQLGVLR